MKMAVQSQLVQGLHTVSIETDRPPLQWLIEASYISPDFSVRLSTAHGEIRARLTIGTSNCTWRERSVAHLEVVGPVAHRNLERAKDHVWLSFARSPMSASVDLSPIMLGST